MLGKPGQWSSIATIAEVDGARVYMTEKRVMRFSIVDIHDLTTLNWTIALPTPLPLFAFARFASPMVMGPSSTTPDEPTWLYTCFGYTYLDHRFLFFVYPDHITLTSVTPCSDPFVL